eukprot:UN3445
MQTSRKTATLRLTMLQTSAGGLPGRAEAFACTNASFESVLYISLHFASIRLMVSSFSLAPSLASSSSLSTASFFFTGSSSSCSSSFSLSSSLPSYSSSFSAASFSGTSVFSASSFFAASFSGTPIFTVSSFSSVSFISAKRRDSVCRQRGPLM